MDLRPSARSREWLDRLAEFMTAHVYPAEAEFEQQVAPAAHGQFVWPVVLGELKTKARRAGLWNLFMGDPAHGPGLSNVEYAPLAELMGRVYWAPEVFNCNAPDTGNMELLHRYGTPEQRARWLEPLLAGEIRSAYCMTEPAVASSDATNLETRIRRDGDCYVVSGRKWWTTNGLHPHLRILIVMGLSNPEAERHRRHAQILVEPSTHGVTILRHLPIFGFHDAPAGHAEILFDEVRVPLTNLILGEGRGFEVAQGRLGAGRIHHCMRSIGVAERALEMMCRRLMTRQTFGVPLSSQSVWEQRVGECRAAIESSRALVYRAAWLIDQQGLEGARTEIAAIKVVVPRMLQSVVDITQQAFGAAGITDDFGLAAMYARARTMRIVDGPDEVHNRTVARLEFRKYRS